MNRWTILGNGAPPDVHSLCRVCRHLVYDDAQGFVQPHEHRSVRCDGSEQPGAGHITRREIRAIKRAAWRNIGALATVLAALAVIAAGSGNTVDPPSIAGGKFEVTCRYSHSAQVDPIVSPGSPMSAHLHDFFGNETTDQNSTGATLVGTPTTCLLNKDSAAYWLPASYRTDTGARVLPTKVWAYYFGTDGGPTEVHFPAGLKMLTGNHDATQPSEAENIAFSCGNGMGPTHSPIRAYPYNCKTDPAVVNSEGVVAIIKFPFCYDGAGIEPTDVTFPNGNGDCGGQRLVQLQMHVHYGQGPNNPGFERGDLLTYSSGPWYTLHADFMNGWRQAKLNALVDGCQNAPNLNCGFLTDDNPGPGKHG